MYRSTRGTSTPDFYKAAHGTDSPLELDTTAVASMLSFQYVIDGHTLLKQVTRRPWLEAVEISTTGGEGARLPEHQCRWMTPRAAAGEMLARLQAELTDALGQADRITILLSGGLDSRLASAVCVQLARRGLLTDQIRAVTWGLPDSRDLHFACRIARYYGIPWIPVELQWADLQQNIDTAALQLGGLVSPVHLHAMTAITELDWHGQDIILAASLGNGLGRGQYLYRHVSHTRPIRPANWLNLMHPQVFAPARNDLTEKLQRFRGRLQPRLPAGIHECEMQAHYISGQLLHAFSHLHRSAAPVHQALSHHDTYGFLWSLSPALRTQLTYRTALSLCDPELTGYPDASTNRSPKWFSMRERNNLSPFVHRYPSWITHELADLLDASLDPQWFDDTGIFCGAAVRNAWLTLRGSETPHAPTAYLLIWLCTFRRLIEELESRNLTVRRPKAPAVGHAEGHEPFSAPPWGFAGRGPGPLCERIRSWPHSTRNFFRFG